MKIDLYKTLDEHNMNIWDSLSLYWLLDDMLKELLDEQFADLPYVLLDELLIEL